MHTNAFSEIAGRGGDDEFSLRFITFPLHGLSCVFTVMSNYSLDDLGFESPSVPSDVPP